MKGYRIVFWVVVFVLVALSFIYDQEGGVLCAAFLSWIGDAVKGVTGIGMGLFGGIKAGKERKKAAKALRAANEEIDREKAWNEGLFDKEYYQNYLQRSENQAALKQLRDQLTKRNGASAQTAVITGATPEATAKEKELSNEAYGNTMSAIAANSTNAKEAAMNRYRNYRAGLESQKMGLYGEEMNLHNQNARQWANLMQNGLNNLADSAKSGSGSNGGSGDSGLAGLLSSLLKK